MEHIQVKRFEPVLLGTLRDERDLKIDVVLNNPGWYQIRWVKLPTMEGGGEAVMKVISLTRKELERLMELADKSEEKNGQG